MFEEKDRAQRLQTELDVSEQVQKDFVKLSQTLQVTLGEKFFEKFRKCHHGRFSCRAFPRNFSTFRFCRQVQLERIRQADSLERIRLILNDTNLTDINQLPDT